MECFSRTDLPPPILRNRFSERIFPAETFHNAYPSAGMPTGRCLPGVAERSEGKVRRFGMYIPLWKKQQVKFLKALVLSMKNVCSFLKDLLFFSEKNRIFLRFSNVWGDMLLM